MEIVSRIYRSKGGKKDINKVPTHTIHYGYIYDGEELIDEVLVMVMRAPRTFTGEDTVEIDCHGGVYAMKRVLETVLKNGGKTASPGEFTKRAFLNGKMDLSQAEAVMDVIQAKNEYALKSSVEQLKGSVQKAVKEIRKDLIYHIAYIESALDDPEHISLEGYAQELLGIVEKSQKEIAHLLKSASDGKIIKEGIRTVILGKPNAGKSSLLNVLVGENRAIVTDIEGTTRDILEEYINLHGISLRMIDTAGIRETEDVVEKIGVNRARDMAKEADLILYVVDSSRPLDENDEEIISMLDSRKAIVLYNKTGVNRARDMAKEADLILYVVDSSRPLDENDEEIISMLDSRKAIVLYNKTDLESKVDMEALKERVNRPVISVSAKEETGIRELEKEIKNMFFSGEISFNDEVYITNARHKEALMEAAESLGLVKNSIEMDMPEDFFSIDLMNAYESLGRIIGEAVGEDLVNEIFSKFCMGK